MTSLKAAFALQYLSNQPPREITALLIEVLSGLPQAHLDTLADAVIVEIRRRLKTKTTAGVK